MPNVAPLSTPDALCRDASLSFFQKVLLTTDGTVTQLLELYTGLPISVRKLEQRIVADVAPSALAVSSGEHLLKRIILLRNEQQSLLFASSYFVIGRMPTELQQALLSGDQPIGLLWRNQRMETYREILSVQRETDAQLAPHFDLDAQTPLLSRTYLIHYQRRPLGMITEKFPENFFRN